MFPKLVLALNRVLVSNGALLALFCEKCYFKHYIVPVELRSLQREEDTDLKCLLWIASRSRNASAWGRGALTKHKVRFPLNRCTNELLTVDLWVGTGRYAQRDAVKVSKHEI